MEDNIRQRTIETEMKESYLNYAMSVIASRALPDVRDGLKPVQRRILYSMHESGILSTKPYKKSARVVGDVLGKYHPHGDSAVYLAMVRMAQNFSMRYLLVNGQGNFGSVDGDSAAAMRYTEARLSKMAEEMVKDIDKDTVEFIPNYDNSLKEPTVLPAMLPNLLLNGVSGIAVGMATKIPPHNLCEVVDGVCGLIDNPAMDDMELFSIIKGPDFPTGGTIYGIEGIISGYRTGHGSLPVRAKASVEQTKTGFSRIIVTEIPYEVNKTTLIEQIADLVKTKKIVGIRDLRDESDRKGMRIVIELKKEANSDVILNQLYKHTNMQTTFAINMLALVNNEPEVLTLREIITYFIAHRYEVVRARTSYDLEKSLLKAHILEGLIVALDNIDEVITIIKTAPSPEKARISLIERFELSEKQAQAILDMKLSKLTGMEQDKIRVDLNALMEKIADLNDILAHDSRVYTIIKDELEYLKEKYGDERATEIVTEGIEFEDEDLIPREDIAITISRDGYLKSIPVDTYKTQRRGGVGILGTGTKEEDIIEHLFVTSTHNHILFFTNKGKVYWLKGYKIPQGGRHAKGKAAINLLGIEQGELISAVMPIDSFETRDYLFFATKKGYVKKTPVKAFSRPRTGGIIALTLDAGDELIKVRRTTGDNAIIIGTSKGAAIKFSEQKVRAMGRTARGVKGITLAESDSVVGMDVSIDGYNVFTITEKGYGKQTPVESYPLQNRGGKGVINIKTKGRNGNAVAFRTICDGHELMLASNDGIILRPRLEDIPIVGRNTQGVIIMKLREGDSVSTVARFLLEEEKEEGD